MIPRVQTITGTTVVGLGHLLSTSIFRLLFWWWFVAQSNGCLADVRTEPGIFVHLSSPSQGPWRRRILIFPILINITERSKSARRAFFVCDFARRSSCCSFYTQQCLSQLIETDISGFLRPFPRTALSSHAQACLLRHARLKLAAFIINT